MKCAYYRVQIETLTRDPSRHLSSNLEQSAVRSDLSLTSHEETLLRITPLILMFLVDSYGVFHFNVDSCALTL